MDIFFRIDPRNSVENTTQLWGDRWRSPPTDEGNLLKRSQT
ncbi:hypothetical protein [Roseofilum sp. Belize Diploria]|nr:hypothetical protein [Roseofilum sp. Belize Diploria]